MLGEHQSETGKKTKGKWWQILLVVAILATLFSFGVLGTGTASAHAAIPRGLADCKSNVPMYTRDDGGLWRHERFVGIYVPTDVSDLYNKGLAYITYDQGNDHFTFYSDSTNPFQMKTRGDIGINLWGVSTLWSTGNSNWRTTNSWWAHYNCRWFA